MMNEIYRFRRIENLLGQHQELSRQEIFFASPDQLNDPMEGYRDIFWQGDDIVWENLLINYLRCLNQIFFLYVVVGESKKLTIDDLPMQPYGMAPQTPQSQAFFEEIKISFFKNNFIKTLPGLLAERTSPIRRSELSPYLSFVQHFAINTLSDHYYKKGFSKKRLFYHNVPGMDKFVSKSYLLSKLVNRLERKLVGVTNAADLLFSVADRVRKKYALSVQYGDLKPETLSSNAYFLTIGFPDIFLDKLERLMFSNWYSASFLGNCTNSAIWGHYADNHQGVCLIFEPEMKEDTPTLDLCTVYGYNGAPMKNSKPHYFQQIEYHHKHVAIDFFRSLGRAPLIHLHHLWYKNLRTGKTSICAEGVGTDEWRQQYWANFKKAYTVKLEEWSYEEEYRLVINDMLNDYSKPADRKMTYDFRQLKGIIFGIKTPFVAKQQMINIIKEKCGLNNRQDFGFYEAYYNQSTGKIDKFRLDILNVNYKTAN